MVRIAVLGGTGYTGGNIVREAAARGHRVTASSRNAPATPVPGVYYVQGSLTDQGALAAVVADQDVVVEALAPRGELAGRLQGLVGDAARLAAEQQVRLIVVGGWSSLRPAAGEPRFVEGDVPAAFRPEAEEMTRVVEDLEQHAGLDWLFVSPAQQYGSHDPGTARGRYRFGDSVAILDEQGTSHVSGADFARAIVDEIERHERSGHVGVVA